jgi:ATP-dependent DNA helicase RecG
VTAAIRAIEAVRDGSGVGDLECQTLDFKEEAGRRRGGRYGPGSARNERAATALAEEAACLANADGGVLVVGVDDKATGAAAFVGADLDAEWLRERVWESTEPHLAVDVLEHMQDGVRVLLVVVRQGYRLHRSSKRFKHRIGRQCVEMSPEDQRRAEEARSGYDWSAELSDTSAADVSAAAVERVRHHLSASGEESRRTLASRPTPELLRALNVADRTGRLTNAGRLLFVAGDRVLVDYQRRSAPGASSTDRVEATAPLLTAYAEIKTRIDAVNEERQLQLPGGVRPRVRLIPDRAVREALDNALMHRDYRSADAVRIEYAGSQLVISSPGGFPPGVNAGNIISERSHPRNRALAAVFRSLRLAEEEGVGVDRIYRDMIGAGHELPVFAERSSRVRCVLTGGEPSEPIVALMASLPHDAQDDVDLALVLHALLRQPSIGAGELAALLQKLPQEATEALRRGEQIGLLHPAHDATRTRPRMRLSDAARARLGRLLPYLTTSSQEAEEFVVRHLAGHGQVKPRDVAEMLGVSDVQGSRILRELREAGTIAIGSRQHRGRGVFHVRGPRFDDAARRNGIAP